MTITTTLSTQAISLFCCANVAVVTFSVEFWAKLHISCEHRTQECDRHIGGLIRRLIYFWTRVTVPPSEAIATCTHGFTVIKSAENAIE